MFHDVLLKKKKKSLFLSIHHSPISFTLSSSKIDQMINHSKLGNSSKSELNGPGNTYSVRVPWKGSEPLGKLDSQSSQSSKHHQAAELVSYLIR